MNLTPEQIDTIIRRLKEAKPEVPALSPEERQAVRQVLQAWKTLQTGGVFVRWGIWIIMTLGALALAWRNFRTELGWGP